MNWKSLSNYFLCIFFLLVVSVPAFAVASLPSTDVRFYRPFEEPVAGQAKLNISTVLKGECHNHSTQDQRSDAWQCQVGNQVFDPCFIKTYIKPELAMCVMAPWKSDVVVIDLKAQTDPPFNKNNNQDSLDMSVDDPWAIYLMDGTHCIKAKKTESAVNGQRIKYVCDNNAYLVGQIQRCELIWKVLYLPSRTSDSLKMTQIKTAWY